MFSRFFGSGTVGRFDLQASRATNMAFRSCRDVGTTVRPRSSIGDLEQKRALTDSRIATDKHKSAGNNTAAEHAIKFSDP